MSIPNRYRETSTNSRTEDSPRLAELGTRICGGSPTPATSERCKHAARVAYATGTREIPPWVDTDAVDAMLGEHVDATPQVAATDGGILEAGDDGEILTDDENDDSRPDDCDCGDWNADADLPCWPCYRDGFDAPNPSAGEE